MFYIAHAFEPTQPKPGETINPKSSIAAPAPVHAEADHSKQAKSPFVLFIYQIYIYTLPKMTRA
jgi:hypothetical protein